MADNSKLDQMIDKFVTKLNDQVWFQDLKAKWDELDLQSQIYVKYTAGGFGIVLAGYILLSSIAGVYGLKSELEDKNTLLATLDAANSELRTLQATSGLHPQSAAGKVDWTNYFNTAATRAGFSMSDLKVTSPRSAAGDEMTNELFFDLAVNHINIKQVVRFAYFVENGDQPAKLRHVAVDTEGAEGFLSTTFHVSAYELKEKSK